MKTFANLNTPFTLKSLAFSLAFGAFLSSCATPIATKHEYVKKTSPTGSVRDDDMGEPHAPPVAKQTAATPAAASEAPEKEAKAESKSEEKHEADAKPQTVAAQETDDAKPAAESVAVPKVTGIRAEQSLQWLVNGNARYTSRHFRADGRMQVDRNRTMKSQTPHAIVLSCADSRVAPETVFDQGIGEIYTVRVEGEALDNSVIASLEHAVDHLGPHLLVVMGHTNCSAVSAAVHLKEGESAGSPALDQLLATIRPHLASLKNKTPSRDLDVEATLNADGMVRDLLARSPLIKAKVEAGVLVIKPALYRGDTGKVKFF